MFKSNPRTPLRIDNATIILRNFAGREGPYNREGDRNFGVLLDDPEVVEKLIEDGWNVKYLKPKEEGDTHQPWMHVSVSYRNYPPKLALVTRKNKTILSEEMLPILDNVRIERVDLAINPFSWSVNGNSGIKAYLKTLYLTMEEDELDIRYENLPEVGFGSFGTQPALEAAHDVIQYDFEGEVVEVPRLALER